MRYLAQLTAGRIVLWCYLLWYLFFAARYFDPSRNLWLTSLGLSAIIGVALVISTWRGRAELHPWPTIRLFLMPFCVSSFAALVKGRGFILVFAPRPTENFIALGVCGVFCLFVAAAKVMRPRADSFPSSGKYDPAFPDSPANPDRAAGADR